MPTGPVPPVPVSVVVGKSIAAHAAPPLAELNTAARTPLVTMPTKMFETLPTFPPTASFMLSVPATIWASTAGLLTRDHVAPKSADLNTPLAPPPKRGAS